jgi:hypothetical protein
MEKAAIALVSTGKAGSDPAKVLYANVMVIPVGITARRKTTFARTLGAIIAAGAAVCPQSRSIRRSSKVGGRRPGTPAGGRSANGDQRKAMRKIPSVFVRDFDGDPRFVLPVVTLGCEWVLGGEGRATRKRDGTACMVDEKGLLWRRYDAKKGKKPPAGFQPAQKEPDPNTGHWPGWLPVEDGPQDQWYHAAPWPSDPGTYELCGAKFQTNAEHLETHTFFRHGDEPVDLFVIGANAFDVFKAAFKALRIEGVVWHHPDGRMAKLKRSDFGYKWPL